jgi:hypothetical protein
MSCDDGQLGFPIGIKNRNFVKDIPMIIHLQFGFSQFISFREEDSWNFSQSEHIIGPGSHIEYPTVSHMICDFAGMIIGRSCTKLVNRLPFGNSRWPP